MNPSLRAIALTLLLTAACSDAPTAAPPTAATAPAEQHPELLNGFAIIAVGQGQYTVGTIVVDFSLGAVQVGRARPLTTGKFKHSLVLGGNLVEFEGKVTCMAIDEANGRAWIGGVITKNNSTSPNFTTPIHQPGRDVWFRVLDGGEGAQQVEVDRTTFLGFEGGGGIITSAQYCATKPWLDNNANTNPVVAGNLQVH